MYTITDSIHGTIRLSKLNQLIIETPVFNRLNNVYQNSTVYLTFPSCRTKRFEHSIGAMHIGGELFYYSLCNSDERVVKELINKTKKHLSDLDSTYENSFTSHSIFNDSFYDSYIPNFIKDNIDKHLFIFLMESVRILGLLHDIGHPPYSHVVEHSISNALFSISNDIDKSDLNLQIKEKFIKWNTILNSKSGKLHEIMGKKLIPIVRDSILSEIKQSDNEKVSLDEKAIKLLFQFIINIFDQNSIKRHDKDELIHAFIYRFMNYTIDADRLDFIARDIYSSGVRQSSVSLDRMFSNIKVVYSSMGDKRSKDSKRFYLVFMEKIIDTITETLLNRQYIYNQVVYHSKSMKNAMLLERIVTELIVRRMIYYLENEGNSWSIQNCELKLDIDSILEIIDDIVDDTHDQKALEKKLVQWDDHWLTVMLKNKLYDSNTSENLGDTKFKIAELFGSKRKYVTLFKRNSDFFQFKKQYYKKLGELNNNEKNEDIKKFIKSKVFFGKNSPFGQNIVKLNEALLACENHLKNTKYKDLDLLMGVAKRSDGIDVTPYILFSDNSIMRYNDLTNVADYINDEINNMPYFFAYYREESSKGSLVNKLELVRDIADFVAGYTINTLRAIS